MSNNKKGAQAPGVENSAETQAKVIAIETPAAQVLDIKGKRDQVQEAIKLLRNVEHMENVQKEFRTFQELYLEEPGKLVFQGPRFNFTLVNEEVIKNLLAETEKLISDKVRIAEAELISFSVPSLIQKAA